jgi:diguanylate cyclase (GGDEF)-like protein
MDWHRKRRIITTLFLAGIALLVVLAVVSIYLDSRSVRQNAELSRIRQNVSRSTDLLVALIDIETGVRGYLIAGDPVYLEPYYRGRDMVTNIHSELPELEKWTAPGNSDQALGALMDKRRALFDHAIGTARTKGVEAAQEELRASDAKTLMDAMRRVIGAQLRSYEDRSDALQKQADALDDLHSLIIILALSLSIAFSIAKFVMFRGEIANRGEMEQTLRKRNDERRQIADLSAALQLSDSRREAYGVIGAYAKRIMPEVSGAFYVYTASRDQLTLVAQWSVPERKDRDAWGFVDHLYPPDCWGLRQGSEHIGCADDAGSHHPDAAPLNCKHIEAGIGPYACIPIVGRGQILGMLHLRGETFRHAKATQQLKQTIERLVDQLSLSLTNIDLRERLENMALRDGLTGLYNRRFLDEMLEHELAKLRRNSRPAALMLVDVDHFKRFNDTYGHQAGDEALRKVGAALLSAVRASDVVCRYGGEEFLVFLPECDAEEAASKAEALRIAIQAIQLRVGGEAIPPISASFGVAMFPAIGENRTELIQLADRALYRAKDAGRNRVMMAEAHSRPEAKYIRQSQAAAK